MPIRSYEDDVKINKFSLDSENEINPSLIQFWSLKSNQAEDNLEKISAKIDLEIRTASLKNKGNLPDTEIKATADAIKAAVAMHPEVIKAKEELAIYKAASKGIDARKAAIDNLVQLYLRGYYDNSEISTGKQQTIGDNIRENLNKKNTGGN